MEAGTEERARAAWTRRQLMRHRWWTRQAVGESVSEAMVVQAWRRSRSGRAGGGNMIVARVRFKGGWLHT
jgi:hypothetical protein